jgi:hypothetical protein
MEWAVLSWDELSTGSCRILHISFYLGMQNAQTCSLIAKNFLLYMPLQAYSLQSI